MVLKGIVVIFAFLVNIHDWILIKEIHDEVVCLKAHAF